MIRRGAPSLSFQVLAWAAGNTLAGTLTGLAVGVFHAGGVDARVVLMSVLFGNVVGFTVFVCSVALYARLSLLPPAFRVALLALALVSGSAAGTALVLYLFPLYVLADPRRALAVVAINGVLALMVGSVAYAYEGMRWRLAESLREVEEVRLVEARLQEQAARAELSALQARINPHFFFNTLNTISSLVAEDPDHAEEVIQGLADLFRYTFRAAESGPVPLADELEFIQGYLGVERARFGDRLRVAWDVEPSARAVRVPGLLLQPLVENAVAHGIAPAPSGGEVRVSARLEAGSLVVEVADDGVGPRRPLESLIQDGHGLDNVRRRVETYSRGHGSLELAAAAGGRGMVARLRLPADLAPHGPAGAAR